MDEFLSTLPEDVQSAILNGEKEWDDALDADYEAAFQPLVDAFKAKGPPDDGDDPTAESFFPDDDGDGPITESGPPGPPPRDGLVWHGATSRWRNPETGAEHEHPAAKAKAGHSTPAK